MSSATRATRNLGLARLLGSWDIDHFLRTHLGEQMLHVTGEPDRFADLFSWNDLNAILNGGMITYPRARLTTEKGVDPKAYTYEMHGQRWLDSTACQRLMAEGATLIVLGVDEVNEALADLVRHLEFDFNGRIETSIVATFAHVPGLSTHWDSSECFNLQIGGEKEWQVTRPDRRHPLTATVSFPERNDITRSRAPDRPPTWARLIKPGDLIYVPRGWWHSVRPHTVPSLHLSIAIDFPTFSDFMLWYAHECKRDEAVRRCIPMWSTAAERRACAATTLGGVSDALSPDGLEAYLAHISACHRLRPTFALPAAVAPDGPLLTSNTMIRAQSPRSLTWKVESNFVTLLWRGQEHRFDARVAPVLEKLSCPESFKLEQLGEHTEQVHVMAFVTILLRRGIVAIVGGTHDEVAARTG